IGTVRKTGSYQSAVFQVFNTRAKPLKMQVFIKLYFNNLVGLTREKHCPLAAVDLLLEYNFSVKSITTKLVVEPYFL
ncbi:MAG: hypothetical protein K9H16_04885, partial [Bacteroidales bacterium]|nr:hypothetical protein [Bacteroidales bacterium]